VTTRCTVQENGATRTFLITVEPTRSDGNDQGTAAPAATSAPPASSNGTPVYSTFAGTVEVVDVLVKLGDMVKKGQAVAAVEAMKARHDIKAPQDGKVSSINVKIGDEIDSTRPILTLS
jgi:biotin carboxyl carrier protein